MQQAEATNAGPEPAWHALDAAAAVERCNSSASDGLTGAEAKRRVEEHGSNRLQAADGVGFLSLIVRQLTSPLIYLLFMAAALSLAIGHGIDAVVILAVVLLNTVLGVTQEYRAEQALQAIRRMVSKRATVLRDGHEQEVAAAEVVPGDIIVLASGVRVAADARLIKGTRVMVNEASLTGESAPVAKHPDAVGQDTALADRTSMLYMSTVVTDGKGRAVVTATGMGTEMGRIAGEVKRTERVQTPLQKRMGRLANLIGIGGVALAALLFGVGLVKGYELGRIGLFAVALAVSAIPEGLPAAISVTLAAGVRRMARRHAIIRRLPAVETLGSTTIICSDKTGTITRGEMTVSKLLAGGQTYGITGAGYAPEGHIEPADHNGAGDASDLEMLLQIGAYANDSRLIHKEQRWLIKGMPTEGALEVAARKGGLDTDELRRHERLDEIPFSSDLKYMAVLQPGRDNAAPLLLVKGAPDRVLGFCSQFRQGGKALELTGEQRQHFETVYHKLAEEGLRVLAGGYKQMATAVSQLAATDAEADLVFAGFWGINDPPRQDAVAAIAAAGEAGIKVVMLTGDHAETAQAIAHQAGIAGRDSQALTGIEVAKLDADQLARETLRRRVLARVDPSHKMTILEVLKNSGEVVAMTGDGVNDAPALKAADIGVAMGSGTEVAKEAADMVLTDDNFATIVSAIEEGRVIFSNLRRVFFSLITTNFGEVIMLMVAVMLGLQLPLQAVMILWINLVTDGVSTIPLGLEPKHRKVLREPPLATDAGILDPPLIRRILILSPIMAAGTLGLFLVVLDRQELAYAQTVAFVTLAAFKWFQVLNARSRYQSVFKVGLLSNKWLVMGLVTGVVLQILAVHTALGQRALGTVAISLGDWALAIAVSASILVVDEILKLLHVHGREPG